MKSENHQEILERNVLPSVRKLGLSRRSWVFQQDKDIQKHTEMVEKEKINDCFLSRLMCSVISTNLRSGQIIPKHQWMTHGEHD